MQKNKNPLQKDFTYSINETGEYRESWRIFRIMAEFVEGYQFLSSLTREVTIMGSARLKEGSEFYTIARELGYKLGEAGFTVITGGGPGVMEAGNRGAYEAGAASVGLNIQLPYEQRINPYVTKSTAFYYFFTRKVMLTSPANAFIFFPGGFGTMDEFFEVVDLMEMKKMHHSPIILVGRKYWEPLVEFLKQKSCRLGCAPEEAVASWHIVDTAEEAFNFIKDIKDNDHHDCDLSPHSFYCQKEAIDWKIFSIMAELVEGFQFLTGLIEDVTILGSRSINQNSKYADAAYTLGVALAESGFAVVTGGGSGMMESASKGAFEHGGDTIGINMRFGSKERTNPYVKRSIGFQFPFIRKLIITAPSKGFIIFPGGFGTLHQLFEVLTLIQTKKMQKIPVILYDHEFWAPLHAFIKKVMVHDLETVGDLDDELYDIVDNIDDAMDIIKRSREHGGSDT